MASKPHKANKRAKQREQQRRLRHEVNTGIHSAWTHAQAGRLPEAAELLERLDRRFPRQPRILERLVEMYQHLRQFDALQTAAERLLEIKPDSADLTLLVAGCGLTNRRLGIALDYFERFIRGWPDDPRVEHVRETIADLESEMGQRAELAGVSPDGARQLILEHDAIMAAIASQQFDRAEKLAARLWERHPGFAPAGNNLVDAIFAQGRFEESLDVARQILERHPENPYSLANLAIRLSTTGRWGEARTAAERLRAIKDKSPDAWVKQAEVFSYLGDDQAVLEAWREAEPMSDDADRVVQALGHHLAAVACLRLDRRAEALQHWQTALKQMPDLALAQENLDDCWKPLGQCEGPWPFEMQRWLGRETLDAFEREVVRPGRGSDEAPARLERQFLEKHPHVGAIVPALLDRGPPPLRAFALILAKAADTPALRQALLEFVRGQRGSDKQRFNAAQHLARLGALESRQMRLYVQGEWRDILLQEYELHGEATLLGDTRADELALRAHQALRDRDGRRAEDLFRQALELVPDRPSLHNNLANAYQLQGRGREAVELMRHVRERFPDYLFGRVHFAHYYIGRGELDRANDELRPLRSRQRLHFAEFSALMYAEAALSHARGNDDAARQLLKMWEQVLPDDPKLADVRDLVERKRPFGSRQFF